MYSLYVGEFNNHAKKASTLVVVVVVVVVVIVIGGPILFLNAGFLLSKSCLQPILYCN
jgi:ABC-type transport system involved in cytochrome bd biosynthesis fused ATPase/permease subunit